MGNSHVETATCQVCGEEKKLGELMPGIFVRGPVEESIRKYSPGWSSEGYICFADLNRFRAECIQNILESEKGDLTALERGGVYNYGKNVILTKNINSEFDNKLTMGEKIADNIAKFGGSWLFISSFGLVLFFWIIINTSVLLRHPFDPFPFILLNLILSCLAAIQAPVIMMSQNRQEEKDRLRAEHDYQINLKAELEIRQLHDKLDCAILQQWERLSEIRKAQQHLIDGLLNEKASAADKF
jgi:uncharacterized membrane protein